jgi:hypothetical protein
MNKFLLQAINLKYKKVNISFIYDVNFVWILTNFTYLPIWRSKNMFIWKGANKIQWANNITLDKDCMSFCPKIVFSYKWIFENVQISYRFCVASIKS